MRKLYLAVALIISTSCATFSSTVAVVDDASNDVFSITIPALNAFCESLAAQCVNKVAVSSDQIECEEYAKCDNLRTEAYNKIVVIKMVLASAKAAQAIGDEAAADQKLERAIHLMAELRYMLQQYGVM